MVFSSPLTSLESNVGGYRPLQTTTRRKKTLSRKPQPQPLPSSQASQGPTPSQEARRLAHEEEVNPQKYAIIGDNEHLHREQAKCDEEDLDYVACQEGDLSRTNSMSGLTDADSEHDIDEDEIADLMTWDTQSELNHAPTTRASSMVHSAAGQDTDDEEEDTDDEEEVNNDEEGVNNDEEEVNDDEEEVNDFPEHLDGRMLLDFGCWWLTGIQYPRRFSYHALADKLRKDFDLDSKGFMKALRFVQDHEKYWDAYMMGDPDVVLEEAKSEWPHLDESKY